MLCLCYSTTAQFLSFGDGQMAGNREFSPFSHILKHSKSKFTWRKHSANAMSHCITKPNDLFIIDEDVYDLTQFANNHLGECIDL
jgi:hypothetical protein